MQEPRLFRLHHKNGRLRADVTRASQERMQTSMHSANDEITSLSVLIESTAKTGTPTQASLTPARGRARARIKTDEQCFREVVLPFNPKLREAFVASESSLIGERYDRYRGEVSDADDLKIARACHPQRQRAAIISSRAYGPTLFNCRATWSLLQQYQVEAHKAKRKAYSPEIVLHNVLAIVDGWREFGRTSARPIGFC